MGTPTSTETHSSVSVTLHRIFDLPNARYRLRIAPIQGGPSRMDIDSLIMTLRMSIDSRISHSHVHCSLRKRLNVHLQVVDSVFLHPSHGYYLLQILSSKALVTSKIRRLMRKHPSAVAQQDRKSNNPKCQIMELIQYSCNIKTGQDGTHSFHCTPILRLFRQ